MEKSHNSNIRFISKLSLITLLIFLNAVFPVTADVSSSPTASNVQLSDNKDLIPIVLSPNPDIRLYKNFISEEEAKHLIALAKSRLKSSTVLKYGQGVADDKWRTSTTAFLYKSEDPIVKAIEERACKLLGCNLNYMEPIQVVHYSKGQRFLPHYDYFTGEELKYQTSQRQHTLLVYLNEVKEEHGGMTLFPKLNVHIQPVKGAALYFNNLDKDGKVNPLTLHGGEPILADGVEKWACNIWVRNNVYTEAPQK